MPAANALLFAAAGGALAQTTVTPRGIPSDAGALLPSARDILRRQQDKQINTLDRRQAIEESERRQHLERMHRETTPCADATSPSCLQPPTTK